MIEKINEMLKEIGSKFSTDDGLTLCMYAGANQREIKFLRKTFDTQEECYRYVLEVKESYEKGGIFV